jgi:uncharacterized membrane protein YphA (DoxX/SURF4 family)
VIRRGSPVSSPHPLGVIVIAVLTALRCVTISAALLDLEGGPVAEWLRAGSPLPQPPPGSDFEIIARVLLIGLLVASVLVVFGLLARRQWAWVLAIVSSGVILAIDLGWWWSGEPRYGSMLLNAVAVFYLNQREVRAALGGLGTES